MSGALIFAVLIWLAVMIGFAAAWRFTPQRDPVEERLQAYGWQPGIDTDEINETERRQKYPLTQRLLMGLGLGPGLAKALMRADLPMTAAEFTLIVLLVVAFGAVIGTWRMGILGGAGLGILCGFMPFFYLRHRQARRLKALTEQIPDVMTLLVGGLRAGYGLNQAIDTLVQQMPVPSSTEFGRVMKAVSLGVPVQRALKDMAARVGSDDISLVVTAISVQYEMGGNLANVLESISQTVRERIRITREIQVLTAQQRLTGYILAGFPVFLAVALTMIKPDYFAPFFEPGPFQLLPMAALVMMAVGFLIIRRVVDIDV
jgi:tight adherence protein B